MRNDILTGKKIAIFFKHRYYDCSFFCSFFKYLPIDTIDIPLRKLTKRKCFRRYRDKLITNSIKFLESFFLEIVRKQYCWGEGS